MATNSILASVLVKILASTAEFDKGIKASQTALGQFTSAVTKMGAAVGISFAAFQAVGVIKNAIGVIADFEKEMSQVRAITQATDEEFRLLEQSALDLGASTRYTSQQVAELQTEYGRLGFTTSEILAATEATLNLATATGSDLAQAADVAGSTVRAFGLSANETERVTDVMAEAFNKSALGIENFSEAMRYVAPIAAQAGLSIEETSAFLGVLADNGIRGSMAGTSLRKIISDLGGESGTTAEKIQKLADKGLTGADAMSEVGRTAYASLLILAQNTKRTEELTVALDGAAGSAQEAAKIMGDNLAGDIVLLESAYDGLILSFKEGDGVLRDLTQAFTSILNGITSLVRGTSALGLLFKPFIDSLTAPIRALGFLADKLNEGTEAVEDHGEKLRAIESTVQAAFDSGNVEAYIAALDQNINKEEIIAQIRKRQGDEAKKAAEAAAAGVTTTLGLIASAEEELKKYEDSKKNAFTISEIEFFNQKIDETREKLALLNGTIKPLSGFGQQQLSNAQAGLPTDVLDERDRILSTANISGGNKAFEIPPPDADTYIAKLFEIVAARQEAVAKSIEGNKAIGLSEDDLARKQERSRDLALSVGDAFGSMVGDALSGNKTVVQSVLQMVSRLIPKFFAMAIAGTTAGAANTAAPPPVILALAAAGIAGITAIFSKIGHSGGGFGGGGGAAGIATTNVSRIPSMATTGESISFDAKFRLEGPDLAATLSTNDSRTNNRLGG